MRILLAIDDTDNPDTIGTGRLSRNLAADLEGRGLISEVSVTRHQFLVHPDIPYTSHNSSACIAAEAQDLAAVEGAAREFMEANFHAGANPGLCLAPADRVPAELVDLGRRAQREVLELAPVQDLARRLPLAITWWGETGQGCIGAMSGVGLRSTGDDGRFIGLKGIRQVGGVMTVSELIARTGVELVTDQEGTPLADAVKVDTWNWVRPSLRGGRAVMVVRRQDGAWVPAERRKPKK